MGTAMVLLAIPPFFGATSSQVLAVSVGLVSLQAGQSAAVQTRASFSIKTPWLILVLVPVLCVGSLLALQIEPIQLPILGTVIIGISGLLVGVYTGIHATNILNQGKTVSYQIFILQRNLIWLFVVAVGSILAPEYIVFSIPIAWTIFVLARSESTTARGTMSSLVIGAVAGLVYRNDVNVARGMAAVAGNFTSWHYFFIVYAAIQALVGFVVVNEIFSRRDAISQKLTAVMILFGSSIVILLGLSASILTFVYEVAPLVIIYPAVVFVGVLVSIQAAIAHVLEMSVWVYIGGCAGFAALVLLAALKFPPGFGMAAELAISATIVGTALAVQALRANSTKGAHRAMRTRRAPGAHRKQYSEESGGHRRELGATGRSAPVRNYSRGVSYHPGEPKEIP